MAENISALNANVVNIKRGRGRPPKDAAAAAAKAEAMIAGVATTPAEDRRTAPAFGSNEPDIACFLKHVQILRAKDEEIAKVKLTLKGLNKQKKDLRQAAKAEGIVLGELDRALDDADTEQVDLVAREQRYHLYMEWLGKPIGFQPELDLTPQNGAEIEQQRWFNRGDQDGRLGKTRTPPEGIPPEMIQSFLHGWETGQAKLRRENPVTAPAFAEQLAEDAGVEVTPDQEVKTLDELGAKAILILREEDFRAGTLLEDANLLTLHPSRLDAVGAAESVLVVFNGAKRVIKEPGYVDDGASDTPVTDIEEAGDLDEADAFV